MHCKYIKACGKILSQEGGRKNIFNNLVSEVKRVRYRLLYLLFILFVGDLAHIRNARFCIADAVSYLPYKKLCKIFPHLAYGGGVADKIKIPQLCVYASGGASFFYYSFAPIIISTNRHYKLI